MWKHIIFQSLVQFTLVLTLYLYAPKFIYETDPNRIQVTQQIENCFGKFSGEMHSFNHHTANYFILDGKKSSWDPTKLIKLNLEPSYCMFYDTNKFNPGQIKNLYQAFKWYNSEFGSTVHMTIIFNSFVLFALFNQLNSRILDDGLNIFKNLHKNCYFLFVFALEVIGQVIIVQYGGMLFKCSVGGLSSNQWITCLALGSTSLLVSLVLKLTKLEKLFSRSLKENFESIFCCCRRRQADEEMTKKLVDSNSENDAIELSIKKMSLREIN